MEGDSASRGNLSAELASIAAKSGPNSPTLFQNSFWREILNTKDDARINLMELLFASTVVDDEVTVQTPKGPQRKPIKRLAKIPDEKRQCPRCKRIKEDYQWEYCNPPLERDLELLGYEKQLNDIEAEINFAREKQLAVNPYVELRKIDLIKRCEKMAKDALPHDEPEQTVWLNWKPKLTQEGMSGVIGYIMANVGMTFSTGNLEKKKSNMTLYALGIGTDVDEVIFEHPNWKYPGVRITRAEHTLIQSTVAKLVQTVLSRSDDGQVLDLVGTNHESKEIQVSGARNMGGKDKGPLDKIGEYLTH
jgi:hypothetical protein